MIERLPATPEGLAAVAALLDNGGLAAFPTDTVYGIGCRVGDVQALARIFAADNVVSFLKMLQRKGVPIRDLDRILNERLFEAVDTKLAKSGRTNWRA